MQIVPTLNFGGNCRGAIHMYEKAFQGKISCLITYGETNDPEYNPSLKEDQKEYVQFDTKEDVQQAYEVMKEGSKTIYPMEAAPYSTCRIVFVD